MPFLGPKHWPTWFGLIFLRSCTLLPYRVQMWLGSFIGYLSYYLIPRRRHIVETNIQLAFPELSEDEQIKLVKKTFYSTGMGIFETAMAWWGSQRRLQGMVNINGIEHFTKCISAR